MPDNIQPCPFCGSDDVVLLPTMWVFVKCRKCGAQGPQHFHSDLLEDCKTGYDDALVGWNTLSEELQRLRNARVGGADAN